MALTISDFVKGQIYVLKYDFIQTPTIRHNFGTEVVFIDFVPKNDQKVRVKVLGSISDGFVIPISNLKIKE